MKIGHLYFSAYAHALSINDLNLAVQKRCLPRDIESIILSGVDSNKGTLLLAVQHHLGAIEMLIRYDAKPDNRILDFAIWRKKPPKFIRFLIANMGETPSESVLFGAVFKGYGKCIVTTLINDGAIVSTRTQVYAKKYRRDLRGLLPEN